MIREYLEQQVKNWEPLGHPAIMERFVLRKGKVFTAGPRVGRKMTPNECYSNATHFVLGFPTERDEYVEGFVIRPKLAIAIQHAWVRIRGNGLVAMDPTLDGDDNEYMGVVFDIPTLREQLRRNKVYGLLDHGQGINTDLIFKLDPELEPIARKVMENKRTFDERLSKRLSCG